MAHIPDTLYSIKVVGLTSGRHMVYPELFTKKESAQLAILDLESIYSEPCVGFVLSLMVNFD